MLALKMQYDVSYNCSNILKGQEVFIVDDIQQIIMQIIVYSGDARTKAMEAIKNAKKGKIQEARELLIASDEEFSKAHCFQTDLIQKEAAGEDIGISLLMIHAQDHLMNAMTIKGIAKEFVDLYENK